MAPKLLSPSNGAALNDPATGFVWDLVDGGVKYQLQVSVNDTFASPLRE